MMIIHRGVRPLAGLGLGVCMLRAAYLHTCVSAAVKTVPMRCTPLPTTQAWNGSSGAHASDAELRCTIPQMMAARGKKCTPTRAMKSLKEGRFCCLR